MQQQIGLHKIWQHVCNVRFSSYQHDFEYFLMRYWNDVSTAAANDLILNWQ